MPATTIAPAAARAPTRSRVHTALALRIVLSVIALLVCYSLQWNWLRALTAEWNVRLDTVAGMHFQWLSFDTVVWHGRVFHYTIACTFADVWCASLPLVWDTRRRVLHNLVWIAAFTPALFAYNVFRLSLSDVIFSLGVPWVWAHDVLSGFAYLAVWFVVRRRVVGYLAAPNQSPIAGP
jgi:hypothetical protein